MSSTNMINVVYLDFLTKYVKVHKQIKRLNVECERLLYEYNGLGGNKITKKEFSSNHQILIEMIEMIENQQTNYGLLYNDVMLKEYKKAKEHVLYLENLINHIVVENKRLSIGKTLSGFASALPFPGTFASSGTSSLPPSLPPKQVDGSLKSETHTFNQLINDDVTISIEDIKDTIKCDITNCAFYICSNPTTSWAWAFAKYCPSKKSQNDGTDKNLNNGGYYKGTKSSGNHLIMDDGISANKFVYEEIEYTPPQKYSGSDSIDVKIYDKTTGKLTIKLTINFTNINTKKVIIDKKQTPEDLLKQQEEHKKFLKDQEEVKRKADEELQRKANEEAQRKANEEAQQLKAQQTEQLKADQLKAEQLKADQLKAEQPAQQQIKLLEINDVLKQKIQKADVPFEKMDALAGVRTKVIEEIKNGKYTNFANLSSLNQIIVYNELQNNDGFIKSLSNENIIKLNKNIEKYNK